MSPYPLQNRFCRVKMLEPKHKVRRIPDFWGGKYQDQRGRVGTFAEMVPDETLEFRLSGPLPCSSYLNLLRPFISSYHLPKATKPRSLASIIRLRSIQAEKYQYFSNIKVLILFKHQKHQYFFMWVVSKVTFYIFKLLNETWRKCCLGIYGNTVNISWRIVAYTEKTSFVSLKLPLCSVSNCEI